MTTQEARDNMKINGTGLFWGIVLAMALLVIVLGCVALISRNAAGYDEQAHRAEITEIYPSVNWPEYQDAAREICNLNDVQFGYVRSLALSEGPEVVRAMLINTSYLCPNRLDSLKK